MSESLKRIVWTRNDAPGSSGAVGRVAGLALFETTYGFDRDRPPWSLSTRLPVANPKVLGQVHETEPDAWSAAERLLQRVITRLDKARA